MKWWNILFKLFLEELVSIWLDKDHFSGAFVKYGKLISNHHQFHELSCNRDQQHVLPYDRGIKSRAQIWKKIPPRDSQKMINVNGFRYILRANSVIFHSS